MWVVWRQIKSVVKEIERSTIAYKSNAPHGGDVVVLCHLSRKALFQLQERKIRKTADLIKKNYKLLQVFLKCIIFLFSSFQQWSLRVLGKHRFPSSHEMVRSKWSIRWSTGSSFGTGALQSHDYKLPPWCSYKRSSHCFHCDEVPAAIRGGCVLSRIFQGIWFELIIAVLDNQRALLTKSWIRYYSKGVPLERYALNFNDKNWELKFPPQPPLEQITVALANELKDQTRFGC